jgi:hypothetical protein
VIAQTVLTAFALALAIASLLWQAWTYQHSGSRFTMQAQIGLLLKPGPNRVGGLITYSEKPPGGYGDPGPDADMVMITTVRNIGRLDGTIVSWAIRAGGRRLGPGRNLFGDNPPARVSHDDRLIMVCDLRSVQGLLNLSGAGIEVRSGAREARAVVETGSGRFIESGPLVIP